jgi:hypothetical protein
MTDDRHGYLLALSALFAFGLALGRDPGGECRPATSLKSAHQWPWAR